LAASVYFKNLIMHTWVAVNPNSPDSYTIPQDEKSFLRENMPLAMLTVPASIRRQMAVSLQRMLRFDYPQHFGNLRAQILQLLRTQGLEAIGTGTVVLHELVKRF
jgi:hypothetical protein